MGTPDKNRIVSVNAEPPILVLEIGDHRETLNLQLDEEAVQSFNRVISEKPFGCNGTEHYTYWLYALEYTEGRKSLFFRGDPQDFKVAIRIKRGRSRKLVKFTCSRTVFQNLCPIFSDNHDA